VAEEEKKADAETKASKRARKTDKEKKDGGMVTKVVAAVFGAVVAPILVSVGVAYLKPDKPEKSGKDPSTEPVPPVVVPKAPEGTIHLLGPNLGEHFYFVAFDSKSEKAARYEVSDSEAFQYKDSPERIVVTPLEKSKEPHGNAVLTTKEEFEDFTLRFRYRWGDKTRQAGTDRARKAAILLRAGSEGNYSDENAWPECVSVMIGDGVCGTIKLTSAPRSLTCQARVKERLGGKLEFLGPEGDPLSLECGVDPRLGDHTVPWANYIFRRGFPGDYRLWGNNVPSLDRTIQAALIGGSPAAAHPNLFADWAPLGWHPLGDPTIATVKPPYKRGEWNKVRIDCTRDVIRVSVNDTLVNEIYGLNLKKGKLGFACQGAQYEIRQIDVEIKSPEKAEKEPPTGKDPKKGRTS
jgi:hypothetical protein